MKKSFYPTQVDRRVVRFNALLTILTALIAAVTTSWIPMAVLAADFFIRGFLHPRWSLFSTVSTFVLQLTGAPSGKMIFFPPKQFAARVGLAFSFTAFVLFMSSTVLPGIIVTGTLALFAALECFFNVCMGCIIYNSFIAPLRRRKSLEMNR